MRDIYINSNLDPLTKFSTSSSSIKLKNILPQNTSQIISKTIPVSTGIVKWASPFEFEEKSMKTEKRTSEFSNGGKDTEEILASEER